ncbi:hypothetical protein LG634_07350 [Streptomyces bambusae]|uniref:hypothetical protein n=1 Tax=Streptomyces bambusae TaxID=1550616 RepID=UPI001CFE961B|nr:hypothetical protein [Streptomyces bambusae]MCB5164648.1 hypothetical protein [Streptomyces bambusae]
MSSPLRHAVSAARHVRRTAVRVRRRTQESQTVPVVAGGIRRRPGLRPLHWSVVGGRTLNFAVAVPAGSVSTARLVLACGADRVQVPLEPEPQPDGTVLLTATVPLRHADHAESGARGSVLGDGLWRAALVLTDPAGRSCRTAVKAAAARLPSPGDPTLDHCPSPADGATFRVVRSLDDFALLKVRGPRPHAELVSLDTLWDRVTVHGRLVGSVPAADAAAQAVPRRGPRRPVTVRPDWQGDRFTFDLPLAAMRAAPGRAQAWDLYLRTGRTRLKIARKLTDVRRLRQVHRSAFRLVALADGALVRVHARITAGGAAVVDCADHPSAACSPEAPQ